MRLNRLTWLWPGMRVKRWVTVILLGVLLFGAGLSATFNLRLLAALEHLSEGAYWLTGGKLFSPRVWGVVFGALGLTLIGWGLRQMVRSITQVVSPRAHGRLAETIYRHRRLPGGPHDLQGDVAVQAGVNGLVDGAHTAAAEHADQPVRADTAFRHQGAAASPVRNAGRECERLRGLGLGRPVKERRTRIARGQARRRRGPHRGARVGAGGLSGQRGLRFVGHGWLNPPEHKPGPERLQVAGGRGRNARRGAGMSSPTA